MKMNNCPINIPARRAKSAAIAVLVATCLSGNESFATDGNLDSSFGFGGFAVTGLTTAGSDFFHKPVVLANGKVMVCSGVDSGGPSGLDFVVARFNANGTLDTSFDFDGKVTVDFDSHNDQCNALAPQADGKIIAVGSTYDPDTTPNNHDFSVVSLNADGTLDVTFGAGSGKAIIPFDLGGGNQDYALAVAIQPDGNIAVAGLADTATTGRDFAVVRLIPDGTRDATFNFTGRVTVGFNFAGSDMNDLGDAIVVDDAGRIVVGGRVRVATSSYDFGVIRLLPSGQLDSNFSADGRTTSSFDLGASNSDASYQTILQADGKILMVGSADTGSGSTTNTDMAALRLLPDGSPDSSFGIGGKVVVPFDLVANGTDIAFGVIEDSVGRIVIAGAAVSPTSRGAAVRLLANGVLDGSFGAFGKKNFNLGGVEEAIYGVALQGTQIIVSGLIAATTQTDNFIARLEVDLLFANGFD